MVNYLKKTIDTICITSLVAGSICAIDYYDLSARPIAKYTHALVAEKRVERIIDEMKELYASYPDIAADQYTIRAATAKMLADPMSYESEILELEKKYLDAGGYDAMKKNMLIQQKVIFESAQKTAYRLKDKITEYLDEVGK